MSASTTSRQQAVDGYREPYTACVGPKPRKCLYSKCRAFFTPLHLRYDNSKFCCKEHKTLFWEEAAELGQRILSGEGGELAGLQPVEGRTHNEQVLNVLRSAGGEWIESPHRRLPFVVWHSRVASLREKGYQIECRRVGSFSAGRYQYRIVGGEE